MVLVDPPRAKGRPGDERHDLVGVPHERLEQPAAQGGYRGRHQGDSFVVEPAHAQLCGQGEHDTGDQPVCRCHQKDEVQVSRATPVAKVRAQRGQMGAQPDGQDGRSAPGQPGQAEQQPRTEEGHTTGDGTDRHPPRPSAQYVGQQEHGREQVPTAEIEPIPGSMRLP